MKICSNCGAANDDYATSCMECGASLPQTAPVKSGGGSRVGKVLPIVIIAVVLLAVAVLAIAAFRSPLNRVYRATQKTATALEQRIDESCGVISAAKKIRKGLEKGSYSANVSLSSDDWSAKLAFNVSQARKVAEGNAELLLPAADKPLALQCSMNRKEFEFSFPGQSFSCYGFTYKDLAKNYNGSFLSKIIPVNISETLNFDAVSIKDFGKNSGRRYKNELKKIKDSIEITKKGTQTISLGERNVKCRLYQIQWSEKAINELVNKLALTLRANNAVGTIKKIVSGVEPSCLCYVNPSGQLVGVDFTVTGVRYLLFLEGEDNPWESITLKQTTINGATKSYKGGLFDGDTVRLMINGESGTLFEADYVKASGKYSIYTSGLGTFLEGTLTAANGEIGLGFDLFPNTQNEMKLQLSLSGSNSAPEMLSDSYIDLFDLSLSDIQRLLFDIGFSGFSLP